MVKSTAKAKSKRDNFEDSEDSLAIDLEAVQGQTFEVIPKGTYDVIIDDVEFKMSNASNQPMWAITFAITGGEFKGRKLFTNMSFSEKALPGTKANLQRFAPDLISKRFDPKKIAESGDLTGRKLRVKTKIEAYEGEDRTKVAGYLAAKEGDGFGDD